MRRAAAALDIDFQQRAHVVVSRRGWLGLVAGALLLAGAYLEYAGVDEAVAAARLGASEAVHAARGTAGAGARRPEQTPEQLRSEQKLRAQLDARWSDLFLAVEEAASADIALLELHVDGATHAIRATGEARDFASLMAYVRRLEANPALLEVRLAGHETRRQDPQQPVGFSLSAAWEAKR